MRRTLYLLICIVTAITILCASMDLSADYPDETSISRSFGQKGTLALEV